MTAYEMALKYYPVLWDDRRLEQLVTANILTQKEFDKIMNKED